MSNAHTTLPDGYSECGYAKATGDSCTSVFSGDTLLLNCNIMSNAHTTLPDGYSECGYARNLVTLVILYSVEILCC